MTAHPTHDSHGDEIFVPQRFVLAEFATPEALLEGTRKMREKGCNGLDTHTPYPVHGIEEALGLGRPEDPQDRARWRPHRRGHRLRMMYFMNAVDFPINVANRPAHAPPAFVPITFELGVLLGGFSAFFGADCLVQVPQPYHPLFESENFRRASIDGYFLSIERRRRQAPEDVMDDARLVGAVERRGGGGVGTMKLSRLRHRAAAGRGRNRRLRRGPDQPDGRTASPSVGYYGPSDFFQDGIAMRAPPEGTVPRERITGLPGATSGKEGTELRHQLPHPGGRAAAAPGPASATTSSAAPATARWATATASSAEQMALRPPPSLMLYTDRPVGYIYEVITKGYGLMASYAAELPVRERWAVVAYVRALQIARSATLDRAPVAERSRLEQESP